jgi:hypothetical protein
MKERSPHDRGATIVLLALSLVALLAVAGLAVDGGALYADRRQVQNAADAAAMAGARAFNEHRLKPTTSSKTAIAAAVIAKAQENHAVDQIICTLVDVRGEYVQPCPSSDSEPIDPQVAGVGVRLRDRQDTTFMRVVGISEFRASAAAAATIQSARSGIATPFLICAQPAEKGGQDPAILLDSDPALEPSDPRRWTVNPAAIGQRYKVHAEHVPNCNAQSGGFKGWAATGEESNTLPGWWETQTGDRAGPARSVIASTEGCSGGNLDDCVLVIPLCVQSNGEPGTNLELLCVHLGAFRVLDVGPGKSGNAHDGIFLGEAVLTEGQGGGIPIPNTAILIKLIK